MNSVTHPWGRIAGALFTPFDEAACEAWFAWFASGASAPATAAEFRWALGHYDDGVAWARAASGSTLVLGSGGWWHGHQAAPDVSPPPRRERLQELRLFGADTEVLLWRGEGRLFGRLLRDAGIDEEPLVTRPSFERRLLRGDRTEALPHGFTLASDGGGARQALPFEVAAADLTVGRVALSVRHYFQMDESTGVVRIAATRLVGIEGVFHAGT
jgi:CRISPR-associated protein (TIGR03984 family)